MITFGVIVKVIGGFYFGCYGPVVDKKFTFPSAAIYKVEAKCYDKYSKLHQILIEIEDTNLQVISK